eukprot:UN24728
MKSHMNDNECLESAMDLLSNLCFNNDGYKVLIVDAGGAHQIIGAMNGHPTHYKLLESAFRALGNLSYVQQNIKKLVRAGAAGALLNSIRSALDQEELLRIGISVLSNIVSDGEQGKKIVQNNGVLPTVLGISDRYPDSPDMQIAVMGCIGHLSNKPENIPLIIEADAPKRIHANMERLSLHI